MEKMYTTPAFFSCLTKSNANCHDNIGILDLIGHISS